MGDIIVIGVLAVIIAAIILSIVRKKKKGASCSCGCASCEKRFLCHPETTEKNNH